MRRDSKPHRFRNAVGTQTDSSFDSSPRIFITLSKHAGYNKVDTDPAYIELFKLVLHFQTGLVLHILSCTVAKWLLYYTSQVVISRWLAFDHDYVGRLFVTCVGW